MANRNIRSIWAKVGLGKIAKHPQLKVYPALAEHCILCSAGLFASTPDGQDRYPESG